MTNLERAFFWLVAALVFVLMSPRSTAGYIVGGLGGLVCSLAAIYCALSRETRR